VKSDAPHILLINPWIHDFAAYDFWARPLGLLLIGAILREHGLAVSYIDCLDRFHPRTDRKASSFRQGRGPYAKSRLPKPAGLEDVPRTYSRYGIRPESLRADLRATGRPDLILMTSLMTYWYPGVRETVAVVKEIFPDTPLVLGGIYASLYPDHARRSPGVDLVHTGPGEVDLTELIRTQTGLSLRPRSALAHPDAFPFPALDLQSAIPFVPLLTSRGCPFSCAYCASRFLEPNRRVRSPESVLAEIEHWHGRFGVVDFAIYDDAFLIDSERHALPILEGIIRSGRPLRFHTPNALHIREISGTVARLLYRAGFHTLRLGLETAAFKDRGEIDEKVTESEFRRAVAHLKRAGFRRDRIGAYLLTGLPGQSFASVVDSIRTVKDAGIVPIPAYYSPIPHTPLWEKAKAASRYNLEADPVFTNNAIFPCQKRPFSWETVTSLKNLCAP
jgi:radical SAM superfamily enzyme YgiQ (UPF0313 family)